MHLQTVTSLLVVSALVAVRAAPAGPSSQGQRLDDDFTQADVKVSREDVEEREEASYSELGNDVNQDNDTDDYDTSEWWDEEYEGVKAADKGKAPLDEEQQESDDTDDYDASEWGNDEQNPQAEPTGDSDDPQDGEAPSSEEEERRTLVDSGEPSTSTAAPLDDIPEDFTPAWQHQKDDDPLKGFSCCFGIPCCSQYNACLLKCEGRDEAARKSQQYFRRVGLAYPFRAAYHLMQCDWKEVRRTNDLCCHWMKDASDSTPGIAHAKGLALCAVGQKEAGAHALKKGTKGLITFPGSTIAGLFTLGFMQVPAKRGLDKGYDRMMGMIEKQLYGQNRPHGHDLVQALRTIGEQTDQFMAALRHPPGLPERQIIHRGSQFYCDRLAEIGISCDGGKKELREAIRKRMLTL